MMIVLFRAKNDEHRKASNINGRAHQSKKVVIQLIWVGSECKAKYSTMLKRGGWVWGRSFKQEGIMFKLQYSHTRSGTAGLVCLELWDGGIGI